MELFLILVQASLDLYSYYFPPGSLILQLYHLDCGFTLVFSLLTLPTRWMLKILWLSWWHKENFLILILLHHGWVTTSGMRIKVIGQCCSSTQTMTYYNQHHLSPVSSRRSDQEEKKDASKQLNLTNQDILLILKCIQKSILTLLSNL